MNTVNLGPLSFSSILFVSMLAMLVTVFTAWALDRKSGTKIEPAVWLIMLVALLAGRTAFVVSYFDTYSHKPLDMIDIRDGGFSVVAAVLAAGLVIIGFMWRMPRVRKPVMYCIAAGLSVWGLGYTATHLLTPKPVAISDVVMTTLDGQSVPISQFQGKPTVINLWATWCPPCRREMPALQEGQHLNPDIHFVFANQGEVASVIDAYLNQENLSLNNVLLDDEGNLAQDVKTRGLPTTLFLDKHGMLVDMRMGELSSATLQDRLNALR